MFRLHRTIKCIFDTLDQRKYTIHNVSELKKVIIPAINISLLNKLQVKLYIIRYFSNKNGHTENDTTMPKEKKVKLTWLKVSKKLSVNSKHSIFKSSPKSNRKRSNVVSVEDEASQSSAADSVPEPVGSSSHKASDISIVYDSSTKKEKSEEIEVITIDSDESQTSEKLQVNEMGNINSETQGMNVWTSDDVWRSNVGSGNAWYCSASNWAQEYHVGAQGVCPELSKHLPKCGSGRSSPEETSDFTKDEDNPERARLKMMRQWQFTSFGSTVSGKPKETTYHLIFTIMSYNVLAQDLLRGHTYLYHEHKSEALTWEHRSKLLLTEIKEANAEILCLQEVQASHLNTFYSQLRDLGYEGVYKQRTGGNVDGVAIYYKTDVFQQVDHTSVEYYQPGIDVLNRHNVGLIVKLSPKRKPNKHLVVATTHLLFNQKRHDVKLAQMQILLAEVERFAFESFRHGEPSYWPVIITGDMNFTPYTGVYELLTKGVLQYEGLCSRTLSCFPYGRELSKQFLPKYLDILDTCQHWGILRKRLIEKMDHKSELKLLKLYNSDHQRIMKEQNIVSESNESSEEFVENSKTLGLEKSSAPPVMPDAGYSTGKLTHNLNLRSVYSHGKNIEDYEVTTKQNGWVTVDYIFYSCTGKKAKKKKTEGNLKLVSRYTLLKGYEAESFGPIPNMASPSDHYPLLATFFYDF
ncbi:protein angel homolog 2 [Periplaneta americana]|uniref:protein angel homolog 2 n=1 Tax=Periplaneta americana TaxID=6978 RepID=UPI0037E8E033